jgi:ribulokinase|tara:strand:+ start:6750 stop:8330 length:1581 start_codon:yes stop_codon:yes gene_type:complete
MVSNPIVGMGDTFVLGLDGGTEGMRAGLFTPDGDAIFFTRHSYPSQHPRNGWAEQNPEDWWRSLALCIKDLLEQTGVNPKAILGMSLSCTSYTMVCATIDGIPLRPALMWMDVRSHKEAVIVRETGDPALKYTGYRHSSAEWMLSKALWVKHNEPEVFGATQWISDYVEWMGFRLTGERAVSINSAAIRCYYDRLSGGWPTSLWEAVGVPELSDKVASRVINLGDVVGYLSEHVASELGLPAGIPLAQGGADAFVGMIGLGVVRPGPVALITGSSHLMLLQTEEPRYADGLFGAYTDALIPGQFTVEGGQSSTGSVVNWFAKLTGKSPSLDGGLGLTELSMAASKIRPGSEGVMALDYWQGNRSPYVDAEARGMFWGLSLNHGPAHMFRALLESICYGTNNVISTIRSSGESVDSLVACGGALNSPFWMQLHADISGIEISTTKVPEAVTLGSGILAAVGAGIFPNVTDAVHSMVHTSETIVPDLSMTQAYRSYSDQYLESYSVMKDLMHKSAAHERTTLESKDLQ